MEEQELTVLADQKSVEKYLESLGADKKVLASLDITWIGGLGTKKKVTIPAGAQVTNYRDSSRKFPSRNDLCTFEYEEKEERRKVYVTVQCEQRVTISYRAMATHVAPPHMPRFNF